MVNKLITLLCLIFAFFVNACAGDLKVEHSWVSVDRSKTWSVVGEWVLSEKKNVPFNYYTISIVESEGRYIKVWDGELIAGCCTWPQGILLTRMSDSSFKEPYDNSTYTIRNDGVMEVKRKDGTVLLLSPAEQGKRFSITWK